MGVAQSPASIRELDKTAASMSEAHNAVLPSALHLPAFVKLEGKRVVLASSSPRRQEILRLFGLDAEICKSSFEEDLPHDSFDTPGEYAAATGSAKAVDVYTRLVEASPEDPPDLVIGADTVVVSSGDGPGSGKIFEKPSSKAEQLSWLEQFNGETVDIFTGVTLVQPQLAMPGYSVEHLLVGTTVRFADNPPTLLRSYVDCGEGMDRAGGFAIQGLGGMLIKGIEGDWYNALGFPAQAFFEWLGLLADDGKLLEMD